MSIARARRFAASVTRSRTPKFPACPSGSRPRAPERAGIAGAGQQFDNRLKAVRLALLGCGTVGEGVVRLLRNNAAMFERKLGAPLELAGVADRTLKPIPALGIDANLITRDAAGLIGRGDIDIVAELFGGHEPARSLILQALAAGKDVVTANKA